MAALQADLNEARRIAGHYGPRLARDGIAFVGTIVFVVAFVGIAAGVAA